MNEREYHDELVARVLVKLDHNFTKDYNYQFCTKNKVHSIKFNDTKIIKSLPFQHFYRKMQSELNAIHFKETIQFQ